jgi:D-sedoheptulose 7-phosphate isomerase
MNTENYIQNSIKVKESIIADQKLIKAINEASNLLLNCLNQGGKILLAGNGGSAADSQHIAAEFVSRFQFDRPGLSSIALTTDTSALTAISNDYGFELLFSRQLQAIGNNKDVFIGITTSGKSPNIIKAFEYCKDANIKSICFTGNSKALNPETVDLLIEVPSKITAHIQESHIMIGHILCMHVENELFLNKED